MLEVAFRHHVPGRDFEIDFTVPTPGTTVLFGPSGAGKSTVAAVVAGLVRPAESRILIEGTVLAESREGVYLPPERRRIGVVFQDARLFPHLSVAANLRYGLRRAAAGPFGWTEVINLLGIADLLPRRPRSLSGGEQQRVAIGRALLSQPRLLVMDEPLASLDGPRRAEILPFLAQLRTRLALPILYITHAMDEVARLADTLVLIERGRSIAVGPLARLAADAALPLAQRDDAATVLACHVREHLPSRALTRLSLDAAPGLDLLVPLLSCTPLDPLRVRIPATDVILATTLPANISVQNILPVRLHAITQTSTGRALVELRLGDAPLLARITEDAVGRLGLVPGGLALVLIKSMSLEALG